MNITKMLQILKRSPCYYVAIDIEKIEMAIALGMAMKSNSATTKN